MGQWLWKKMRICMTCYNCEKNIWGRNKQFIERNLAKSLYLANNWINPRTKSRKWLICNKDNGVMTLTNTYIVDAWHVIIAEISEEKINNPLRRTLERRLTKKAKCVSRCKFDWLIYSFIHLQWILSKMIQVAKITLAF
jgi:hypothetical protein